MTIRRVLKIGAFVTAGAVTVTAVVSTSVGVVMARRPLPDRSSQISLTGLSAPVEVVRDERGVAQVYADTPADLFRVQGYLTAQERFFQMDLNRHITSGRLSELVGENPDALNADKVVRTLGWRRVAQEEWPLLSPGVRNYLTSYANGVNDYLRGRSTSRTALAYTVLGTQVDLPRVEPWTPIDSLAWLKAMAWDLKSNYDEELARARIMGTVGSADRVSQLYPAYPSDLNLPILPLAAPAPGDKAGDQTGNQAGNQPGGKPGQARTAPEAGVTPSASPAARNVRKVSPERAATAPAGTALPEPAGPVDAGVLQQRAAQQVFASAAAALNAVPSVVGRGDGLGSNAFVVGGSLTKTGKPILMNDTHQRVSLPGVFLPMGLHCRTVSPACPFEVAGMSMVGTPGITVGHNARIAWGITNLYADVTDFYLERVVNDQVMRDGHLVPLTLREEVIKVNGGKDVTITVRSTAHGPILSDAIEAVAAGGASSPATKEAPSRGDGYALSLSWTALTPGRTIDAIFGLNVAKDFESFRQAALKLEVPAQNVVYADVDGNIGYQTPGVIPVRAWQKGWAVSVDGTWPLPGWDSRYDWRGVVPKADLPFAKNPADGFIVASNQQVRADNEPFLGRDFDYGFRAQRVRDVLVTTARQDKKLSLADLSNAQNDTRNPMAAVLNPYLLKITTDEFTTDGQNLLRGWDGLQPRDSASAAYFNAVWAELVSLTFNDELPPDLQANGGSRWMQVVRELLNKPRDPWWDDKRTPGVVETRDAILPKALEQARLRLTSELGKDPSNWTWGRLHQVNLDYQVVGGPSSPGILRWLINQGPYDAPGGSAAVDAFSWDAGSSSFDVTVAPSMRLAMDLGNLDNSAWVIPAGVSSHPGDSHFDDQSEAWLDGELYPWPFSTKAVGRKDVQRFVARTTPSS